MNKKLNDVETDDRDTDTSSDASASSERYYLDLLLAGAPPSMARRIASSHEAASDRDDLPSDDADDERHVAERGDADHDSAESAPMTHRTSALRNRGNVRGGE